MIDRCPEDSTRLLIIAARPVADRVGTKLAKRFTLVRVLGEGGFAAVYEAIQHPVNRRVAVKILHRDLASDELHVKRFFAEAQSVSVLKNQHTISLFDFGQAEDGSLFMVMEYISGMELGQLIDEHGPMSPGQAAHLTSQICESLSEAHDHGIVHRDLKPANVLVEQRRSGRFVKVLDFGIAKIARNDISAAQTRSGGITGTPTYVSPEQVTGDPITGATDLYAVGLLLYFLLTGREPFYRDTIWATMAAQVKDPVPDVRDHAPYVPDDLADLITSLLQKSPKDRPQRAHDVGRQLMEISEAAPAPPPVTAAMLTPPHPMSNATTLFLGQGPPSAPDLPQPERRNPRRWATAVAATLAMAGATWGAVVWMGPDPHSDAPVEEHAFTREIPDEEPSDVPTDERPAVVVESAPPPRVVRDGNTETARRPQGALAETADISAWTVRVSVTVTPADAQVQLPGGEPTDVGPHVTLPFGHEALPVLFLRRGYESRSIEIMPSSATSVTVSLKKRPRRRPRVPTAPALLPVD